MGCAEVGAQPAPPRAAKRHSPRARATRPGAGLAGLALAVAGWGCAPDATIGGADAGPADAAPPSFDASLAPQTLSQTGLYLDTAGGVLAPGVRPFEPRFELWTDGAEKRRWVYLPSGAQIDNTSGDYWIFPEGTRLWKEFSRDGARLETRLLIKTGPDADDWYMMGYVWDEHERDARAAPLGETNVRGTGHEVPGQHECRECHDRMPDRAIGFSAIQLDHVDAQGVTLHSLLGEGRLRYGTGRSAPPHYPLPGTEREQQVLGYLHSNCGGCHHNRSEVLSGIATRPILLLSTAERDRASVQHTPAYASTVSVRTFNTQLGQFHIVPGEPDESTIYRRMSSRAPNVSMPPLGTAQVDDDALARIRAWIEAMPPPADAR